MNEALIIQTSTAVAPVDPVTTWHHALQLNADAGQISRDTMVTYRNGLRKFHEWAAARANAGDRVDRDVILKWIAHLRAEGHSVKSISVWLTGVRAFFQWMLSQGRIDIDPTAGVKAGRHVNGNARRHKRDRLTDEEVEQLLATKSLSKRTQALIWLMLYTGARGIEAHRAQIEDIRTEQGETVIYVQGKGRDEKELLVIAAKPARDALNEYLLELAEAKHTKGPLFATERKYGGARRAISRRTLRAIVKEAFRSAGIPAPDGVKTVHSLRHTAATKALEQGADIRDVQKMLRHGSVQTTEIYAHEKSRIENAAEKKISYGQG